MENEKRIKYLRKKAMALPEQPGVYIMKNSSGAIIYIGKAKVLCNRVSQYFGSQNNHSVKVRKMVSNVSDFDYIIVESEFEALVLECSLIKLNKPKYNILLKDDKGYYYIRYIDNGWKMIYSVKQKTDDGCKYFGPFTASEYVSSAVRQALDIFKLPHCNKKFPQDIGHNSRPCLNYYINLCSGACCGKIGMNEHNENADSALRFVTGGKNYMLKALKEDMLAASENLEFERAAKLRDRINAIEKVSVKQHVVSAETVNQDVFACASLNEKSCFAVMRFRSGGLVHTDTFVTDRIDNPDEEYPEMIINYLSADEELPERICIDEELNNAFLIEEYLLQTAKRKITVYTPKSGEAKKLIDMTKKNAEEKLALYLSFDDRKNAALHELQEALGLKKLPLYIEAYDISNTAGHDNVGGMVVFRNGSPFKKGYRRFMIKSFDGQDDFRSLAEVISRRISEYKLDPDSGEGFGIKPDLILLDGGIGQVHAVKEIMDKAGFDVPLFGMVKDSKHRTRAITTGGREITINDKRSVFAFVSNVQEEVHRYTIAYHHKLNKKNTLVNTLTEINGVGERSAQKLMIRFKTMAAIKDACVDELLTVKGITKPAAENIYNYFNKKS